jgi:hypothetical protein
MFSNWRTATPNTSLDASGGCVFFKFNDCFKVECQRAAASTQPLDFKFYCLFYRLCPVVKNERINFM